MSGSLPEGWAWRNLPDGVSSDVRRIVAWLAERAEGAGEGAEDADAADDPTPAPQAVLSDDGFDVDVAGRALGHLHRSLDRALRDGAPVEAVEELRDRLTGATVDLWRESLGSEVRSYRQLLRDVSHDIRSPLNSILFLADGLHSEQSGPLNSVQRRQLGVMYSASASLLTMVNDLMDFARTSEGDVGQVAAVPFSPAGVAADVRRLVRPISEHRGCGLRTELDASGPRRGDPQVLSRVLLNLLSNGLEAAGKDGEVVLRLSEASGEDDVLTVEVEDDGPDADLERLRGFVSPSPDGPVTRMLKGRTHGLGLVICGRLVRASGGELSVTRTSEGRTRFTARFPFPRL